MMETKLNWARLYQQGRCKDIGVSWTDEELKAVTKLGIPAEYVRLGILTVSDYELKKAEVDAAKDPLLNKDKEELLMLAHKKGIPATSGASKEVLIKHLGGDKVPKKVTAKKEEKAEPKAKEEKPKKPNKKAKE